jgi:hypothetical protein
MTHLMFDGLEETEPTLRGVTTVEPGAGGAVVASNSLDGVDQLEIEISEDGGLRLLCGYGPQQVGMPMWSTANQGTASTVYLPILYPRLYVALTRRVLLLAAAVAHEVSYSGMWQVGVAASGLGGAINGDMPKHVWAELPRYKGMEHSRVTTGSTRELAVAPGPVVDRLLGPLLRSMDAVRTSGQLLGPPKDWATAPS